MVEAKYVRPGKLESHEDKKLNDQLRSELEGIGKPKLIGELAAGNPETIFDHPGVPIHIRNTYSPEEVIDGCRILLDGYNGSAHGAYFDASFARRDERSDELEERVGRNEGVTSSRRRFLELGVTGVLSALVGAGAAFGVGEYQKKEELVQKNLDEEYFKNLLGATLTNDGESEFIVEIDELFGTKTFVFNDVKEGRYTGFLKMEKPRVDSLIDNSITSYDRGVRPHRLYQKINGGWVELPHLDTEEDFGFGESGLFSLTVDEKENLELMLKTNIPITDWSTNAQFIGLKEE